MKKRLNFNYFLIMSLAIHLGIVWGVGSWLIPYKKNFNLGEEKEEVILLEIGWSEAKAKKPSVEDRAFEKEEIKKAVKIKKKVKKEKKMVKLAKKILLKSTSNIGQKSGRSGREKITSLGGNNSYLEKVRRQIEKVKFYPPQAKMARIEGEVTIEFQIDRLGRTQNININKPSKHKVLNVASRKILAKASPFPKPPDNSIMNKVIETTLVFDLTY